MNTVYDIVEVKTPDLEAKLVAQRIADQLEKIVKQFKI